MNPIISAALADEHRDRLLEQAARARRARIAAAGSHERHGSATHRTASRPFVLFQSWLARGYL